MNDPTQSKQADPAKTGVSEQETIAQDHPMKEREDKRQRMIDKRNAELDTEARGYSKDGQPVLNPNAHEIYNNFEEETQSQVASEENLGETPQESTTGEVTPTAPVEDGDQSPGTDQHTSEPYYLKDGVPTMTLKVKGEILELPVDRVVGIAQKNILAENRLRQAAEAERNLKAREELVSVREQQLQQMSLNSPTQQGVETDDTDMSAIVKETADVLFDGEKADAEETLKRFAEAVKSPTGSTPAQIAEQVTRQATDIAKSVLRDQKAADDAEDYQADLRDGLEAMTAEFPDVMQDDVLFSMVDRRTQDIGDLHPDWPPQKVMMTAAREISDRIGGKTPSTENPATSSTRQARKEALTIVPQQTSAATSPVPQEEVEVDTSPAAVIARMKQDRSAIAGQS